MDVINYGEADHPDDEKPEVVVRPDQKEKRKGSPTKSQVINRPKVVNYYVVNISFNPFF